MTQVELDQLTRIYAGADRPSVANLSLDVPAGSITALLGPSGSGKTTTLRMIAGLLHPTSGDIRFDGASVLNIPAEKRSAVMVFQNHMLFPYMTVAQNVAFGLEMRGVDRATIRRRVSDMLDLVHLPGVGDRRPRQLSGGQQQRIALARALIIGPRVLLLDEPLSNLDVHLRDEMRELILRVQREFDITTIIVTHDQQDAVLLADRVALIFEGRLQQYAPPPDFYRRPATEAVARFFGGVNFIPGRRDGDHVETALGRLRLDVSVADPSHTGQVLVTIRPEQIRLDADADENVCLGEVRECIYAGTYSRYIIQVGGIRFEAISTAGLPGDVTAGQTVRVHFPPEQIWLLPCDPGRLR